MFSYLFSAYFFVLTKTQNQYFPLNYDLRIREFYIRFSLQEYNLRDCGGLLCYHVKNGILCSYSNSQEKVKAKYFS
jgi:hypothetical protein